MSEIPQAAIDAAAKARYETREPTATDLATAKRMLEAAEAVWPHDPLARDPASTTSATIERAPQFDYDRRRPASRAFGFGPPEVLINGATPAEDYRDEKWQDATT
jgi:hypothetical protein